MSENKDVRLNPSEDIQRLTHRVDNIEHKDIAAIKNDISEIKSELHGNKIIMEQNTRVLDKLSANLEASTKTMIELSCNVQKSNEAIDKLEEKIDRVKSNIQNVENKSKFDILQWVSSNFVGVVMAIGVIAYLVAQFIK